MAPAKKVRNMPGIFKNIKFSMNSKCGWLVGWFYEGQLSTGGIWALKGRGAFRGDISNGSNPYLLEEIHDSKRTTENSQRLGRSRMALNPAPSTYQFQRQKKCHVCFAVRGHEHTHLLWSWPFFLLLLFLFFSLLLY